ncbi:response regulator [Massilia sp. W12]|uniref:response regulator n=1 Tax=Massilia sp. W12 TaxID=3126507 RepID=UPI0030CC0E53
MGVTEPQEHSQDPLRQAWEMLYRDRKHAYGLARELLAHCANQGNAHGLREAQAFCAMLESIEKPGRERLTLLQTLAQSCQQAGDLRAALTAKLAMIAIMWRCGMAEQGVQLCNEEIVPQAEALNDDALRFQAYSMTANCHLGNDTLAQMKYLYAALGLSEEMGDISRKIHVLAHLGSNHVTYGNYEEGARVLQMALDLSKQYQLHHKLPLITCNIVMASIAMGHLDEATWIVQSWLATQKQDSFNHILLVLYAQAIWLFAEQGEWVLAHQYVQRCESHLWDARQAGELAGYHDCMLALGWAHGALLRREGQFAQAIERMQAYEPYFNACQDIFIQIQARFELAQSYAALKRWEEAFTAYVDFNRLQAQSLNDANVTRLHALNIQHQVQAEQFARQKAEDSARAKSNFLANMSHEIRTPMNAIIGLAHLALGSELNPKQKDYISKIQRAALSLLGIINDILDFSKVEAGRIDLERVAFSLEEVVANVAAVTRGKAVEKQLEYLIHLPPDVPRALFGDPLRLGQILINLLNNAIKFTERGEISLRCQLLAHSQAAVRLHFAVRDSGIGMNAEQQARLFIPFSQADDSTTRKYGGTGLGLSISQHLVQLMGGQIRVESAPGAGACFSFEIELPLAEQRAPQPCYPARLQDARVLVVDDSALARAILIDAMHGWPVQIEQAANGQAALAAVLAAEQQGRPFTLVLSDLQMPDLDGLSLIRQIRRSAQNVPMFVLVTAYDREEVHHQAEQCGVSGFLCKPLNPAHLVEVVLPLFGQQQSTAAPLRSATPYYPGRRVLLAEDNEINQQIVIELLGLAGIAVEVAQTGREVLQRLQSAQQRYDLVLMDLQMPDMDGHEATMAIRREERFDQLPVIAMTAHALQDIRQRSLAQGMQDYLTKPVNPEDLYHTLSRWLGPSEARPSPPPPAATPAASAPESTLPARLPGIALDKGLQHVAGNRHFYLQLLERFTHSQEHALSEIRKALQEGRRADALRRAHTLRGVAANIGAQQVQSLAEQVEMQCQHEQPVEPLLPALEQALQEVLQGLAQYFSTRAAASARPAGKQPPAAQVLQELRELLQEDRADAVYCFESGESALATLLAPDKLAQLGAALRQFDFELARQLLAS